MYDVFSNGWFTGDTFGISYPDIQTASGDYVFPTTTPVQFKPDAWIQSIDLLLKQNPHTAYLTHFNTINDIQFNATKLTTDINKYVEIALTLSDEENRVDKLVTQLFEYTLNDLRALGNKQDESELHRLLNTDMLLNAQGLDVWLSRKNRSINS